MRRIYLLILAVSICGIAIYFSIKSQITSGVDGVTAPQAQGVYEMVTGDETTNTRSRWDALYSSPTYFYGREPDPFLKQNIEKLPIGKALDIAMGEGRNAVYLAKKGMLVDGVDLSEVALRKARRLARENQVSINTINADLSTYVIQPETYDVILNINFLNRNLVPRIKKGLKEGGIVVFKNHTVDHLQNPSGQSISRDFLLEKGELKTLFKEFEILVYAESNDGKEAIATLIARKPNHP